MRSTPVVQEDTRVAQLEEQVRRLQTSKPGSKGSCRTCTRPTHGEGDCPGRKVECFTCGVVGHFKGSAACSKKKAAGGKKKKEVRANRVDDESKAEDESKADDEASDTDSIGRVAEMVRAAGDTRQNKTADIQLTVLDHGEQARELSVQLLIDSGVYRTLLSEEHWLQVKASKTTSKPKLKRNKVRFVPYGTSQTLEVMGRTKCILKAGAGAEVTTVAYVVKGAKESLLGLKDGEALGIIKIQPAGPSTRGGDLRGPNTSPDWTADV